MEAFSVFFCVIMCVTNILLFVFYLLFPFESSAENFVNLVITRREEENQTQSACACAYI